MAAFADLSTDRAIGMAVGPIPWTAIKAYADEHELAGNARRVFFGCIRAIDRAYLEDAAARQARKDKE